LQDTGASDAGNTGGQELENHMLLKFRADFLYYRKQYSAAVEIYHHVLELLPPTNALVRREVADSLARCQLHLGGYVEALEYAKSLVSWNVSFSYDHKDPFPYRPKGGCLIPMITFQYLPKICNEIISNKNS